MKLLAATLLCLSTALTHGVNGHGYLHYPQPRNYNNAPAFTLSQVKTSPQVGYKFRCNGSNQAGPVRMTLKAGETATVKARMTAPHVSDCSLYLSDPNQDANDPTNYYKIADFPFCGGNPNKPGSPPPGLVPLTFTVPDGVPACDHCVLRWEWIALHVKVEYFASCTDVRVENTKYPNSQVVSGMINYGDNGLIPEFPLNGDDYRNPYDSSSPQIMVGPPMAVFSEDEGPTTGGGNAGNPTTTTTTTTTTAMPTQEPQAPPAPQPDEDIRGQCAQIGCDHCYWKAGNMCLRGSERECMGWSGHDTSNFFWCPNHQEIVDTNPDNVKTVTVTITECAPTPTPMV